MWGVVLSKGVWKDDGSSHLQPDAQRVILWVWLHAVREGGGALSSELFTTVIQYEVV
jgi:hypothetical protein